MLDTHYHFDFLPPQARKSFLAELTRLGIDVVGQTVTPSGFVALEASEFAPAKRSLGYHPWYITNDVEQQLAMFAHAVLHTRFIGEIGLDFSPRRLTAVPAEQQISVLRSVLGSVRLAGRVTDVTNREPFVLSLHAVRSAGTITELLSESGLVGSLVAPVIHRFNGTSDELTAFIRLGGYMSVHPSMLTGKRGRAYVKQVPPHRLLLETDLPASPLGTGDSEQGQPTGDKPGGARENDPELVGASYARGVVDTLTRTCEELKQLVGDDVVSTVCETSRKLYGDG